MKCEAYFTGAEAIPLGLAPEAYPEREGNQAKIQPEALFVDIEEIIAEIAAWGDKEK